MVDAELDLLIKALLNKENDIGGRDDAAMNLGWFGDEKALYALVVVASDASEDDIILTSAGESIGRIMVSLGKIDHFKINGLAPIAAYHAKKMINLES